MVELLEVRPDDLSGDLASGVHKMLRDAFPEDGANEGDYYRAVGAPEVAMVLRDGSLVFGHLGLYTREAQIGNETLEIGMLGGLSSRLIAGEGATVAFLFNMLMKFEKAARSILSLVCL